MARGWGKTSLQGLWAERTLHDHPAEEDQAGTGDLLDLQGTSSRVWGRRGIAKLLWLLAGCRCLQGEAWAGAAGEEKNKASAVGLCWVTTPERLLPWLPLSAFHSLPPTRPLLFIHSPSLGCSLSRAQCSLSHSPPQSPDSGHCSGSILSLPFFGRDRSWPPVGGPRLMDCTSMAAAALKGGGGEHPPWGPARTRALPSVPGLCLSLLSLSPFNLPAQPQLGRGL